MQPTRTEPYRTVPSRAEPYRTMQWKSAISNCRISRWIQPPEQRPLNFQQRSQKKVVFFFVCLFYKKMCTVSYNVQEQHFAVHIVYYHMLMKILVGTQNSTKCEN